MSTFTSSKKCTDHTNIKNYKKITNYIKKLQNWLTFHIFNQNMKTFAPDYRNLGGQGALTNLLTNHYSSLLNAKPVVNSNEPRIKCGAKPRKKQPDLLETLVAFNKVEKVTAYTDSSKPETMQLSNKLSENKKRKIQSKQNFHASNLQNMQNRINRYSSVRNI